MTYNFGFRPSRGRAREAGNPIFHVTRRFHVTQDGVNSPTVDTTGVTAFLAECCIRDPQASVGAVELYEAYVAWCGRHHRQPAVNQWMGRRLNALDGLKRVRGPGRGGPRRWIGIELRPLTGLVGETSPVDRRIGSELRPLTGLVGETPHPPMHPRLHPPMRSSVRTPVSVGQPERSFLARVDLA